MSNLENIDISQIKAAARKALMVASPHYHSWPTKRQERFRGAKDATACLRIRQVLLKELSGVECTQKDVDDICKQLSEENRYILNWAETLTSGIGVDCIAVSNDYLPADKHLLDFATVYDYDHALFQYQDELRKEAFSDYLGNNYAPIAAYIEFRMPQEDRFWYGKIQSVVSFFRETLDYAAFEHIISLIPYEFNEGADHGGEELDGLVFDMRRNANGLEGQLETLEDRWTDYLDKCCEVLNQELERQPAKVYCMGRGEGIHAQLLFLFNNVDALQKVRWRHFSSDCIQLSENADFDVLQVRLDEEVEKAKSYLNAAHDDVMKNYDPTVVKFQKKNKIIFSPQAIDDLDRMFSEDNADE